MQLISLGNINEVSSERNRLQTILLVGTRQITEKYYEYD